MSCYAVLFPTPTEAVEPIAYHQNLLQVWSALMTTSRTPSSPRKISNLRLTRGSAWRERGWNWSSTPRRRMRWCQSKKRCTCSLASECQRLGLRRRTTQVTDRVPEKQQRRLQAQWTWTRRSTPRPAKLGVLLCVLQWAHGLSSFAGIGLAHCLMFFWLPVGWTTAHWKPTKQQWEGDPDKWWQLETQSFNVLMALATSDTASRIAVLGWKYCCNSVVNHTWRSKHNTTYHLSYCILTSKMCNIFIAYRFKQSWVMYKFMPAIPS